MMQIAKNRGRNVTTNETRGFELTELAKEEKEKRGTLGSKVLARYMGSSYDERQRPALGDHGRGVVPGLVSSWDASARKSALPQDRHGLPKHRANGTARNNALWCQPAMHLV